MRTRLCSIVHTLAIIVVMVILLVDNNWEAFFKLTTNFRLLNKQIH